MWNASGSIGAVGAAAATMVAISSPHKRRTTAETATQYMLGDLDGEPLTAHAHARQGQEAWSLARASLESTATEDESLGLCDAALSGKASLRLYAHTPAEHGLSHGGPRGHALSGAPGKALTGLVQAQSQPSKAFDRAHEGSEGGPHTHHPLPDVRYSDLEGTVTAAEDEEMQRQASVTPSPGGSPHDPHGQPWGLHPDKQYHPSAHGALQNSAGATPDGISILVTAGHDITQSGGTSTMQAGYALQRVRSPLQSINEDHEMGHKSARASGTGTSLSISGMACGAKDA